MLFNHRINETTATIANITTTIEDLQRQIDQLREEKLNLETYLQQLGSAENAAESALAQVQTAISMIEIISPTEIETFKAAIDSLFNQPAPQLPSAEPDPQPDPQPEPPTDNELVIEDELEQFVNDGTPTLSQVLITEYKHNGTNGHPTWIKRLGLTKLRSLCKERDLDTTGSKKELMERLLTHGLLESDMIIIAP
jgi:hypothetical protein